MSITKQKKAVIDIGTNSIKLCIAKSSDALGGYLVTYDESKITRLGEGVNEGGKISILPSVRSMHAIQRFVTKAHKFNVNEIRAVGTAVLRKAANANVFCTSIKNTCGIDVEIISGEREAQLSHNAAVLSAPGQNCIIFDIGGGSIEFIYSQNNEISNKLSLNFGVLNIKDKYFPYEPVKDDAVVKACLETKNNFQESGLTTIPREPEGGLLIGIGGAITTMASVKLKLAKYLVDKVNGTVLNINDVESQIRRYQSSTLEERSKIPGLSPGRADIILSGACIVKTIMNLLSAENVIVSSSGIRHAILAEMFSKRIES